MRSPLLDPARTFHAILGWGPRIGPVATSGARTALRWAAHHSGLPMVLVAAIAVVLSWRLIKRTLRLAVEVLIALAFLVAATRMGWLTW
ncbi:MAG TPA: hypothetical protein VH044_03435 [Polyangiaceae bacterium]|nr:hypothetical protein [Polyangiaceae bacterium]